MRLKYISITDLHMMFFKMDKFEFFLHITYKYDLNNDSENSSLYGDKLQIYMRLKYYKHNRLYFNHIKL